MVDSLPRGQSTAQPARDLALRPLSPARPLVVNILMSAIGSRGDVQPLLALAIELRALGHSSRLCVAPNFREWVESHGFACVPIGPDLEQITRAAPAGTRMPKLPLARRQQLAAQMIRNQFRVLPAAAEGCDLVLGFGALQIATRTVAEAIGARYVYATLCPVTLPAGDHPPPKMDRRYPQWLPRVVNRTLWASDQRHWDVVFGGTLNEERAKLGMPNVDRVQSHVFTDQPWIAADPLLASAPAGTQMDCVETGAWLLPDERPLPEELEHFLTSGDPPIYFGFGSMRESADTGSMLLAAARAAGRRAIVSRGWADLTGFDTGDDCIAIGDVSHSALFARVAVVVHHGGAGTTTTAARAGTPQVIVPHLYDQFYWAQRVKRLGVGISAQPREHTSAAALASALRNCFHPEITARARDLATRITPDGARVAAQRLVAPWISQL